MIVLLRKLRLKFQHMTMRRRGKKIRICHWLLVLGIIASVALFIVFPIIFRFAPPLQRYMLFRHTVNPHPVDFSHPENEGLPGTRNFYINTSDGIKLGVWHILPESLVHNPPDKNDKSYTKYFEDSLRDHRPVILYIHGNKANRAYPTRVEMYHVLRRIDYHIITFDYEGFGDSSAVDPTEEGLVNDCQAIYKYLKSKIGSSIIIFWGHSLGTGIATHAAADLCNKHQCPDGVVLESAFNNMHTMINSHPLAKVMNWLPYFEWSVLEPTLKSCGDFKSDVHISHITTPILILHAMDDHVIPFHLGHDLYKKALSSRPSHSSSVTFVSFEEKFQYNHSYISRAPELPDIVKKFVSEALKGG